jgi:hypothetical protein
MNFTFIGFIVYFYKSLLYYENFNFNVSRKFGSVLGPPKKAQNQGIIRVVKIAFF